MRKTWKKPEAFHETFDLRTATARNVLRNGVAEDLANAFNRDERHTALKVAFLLKRHIRQ